MYECHWHSMLRLDPDISAFVSELQSRTMTKNQPMIETEIVKALREEQFFGLIECE